MIFIMAAAIFISSNTVFAQGGNYSAGNITTDKNGGYSFAVPAGWTKEEGDGGFGMINPAKTVIVAIKAHNYRDFSGFMANLNLEGEGLQQIGDTKDLGGGAKFIRAAKRTDEGILVVDTLVLFSPYGGGVAIASFTDDKNARIGLEAVVEIGKSLRFAKPQASAVSSEWQSFLRGKHLIFLQTSGSFSDRIDIYLCPNGNFYYKGNTAAISDGGGAIATLASGSSKSGTWRTTSRGGDQLILEFGNGAVSEYTLQRRQGGGINMNGRRYFVQSDANCQ